MPTRNLLPGVTTRSCPPAIVCDAHKVIRGARRRALARDIAQLAMLAGVDYLFTRWPESRMPFLDRGASLALLRGMNLAIVTHVWLTRALPKWWAQRIASTWCASERQRFTSTASAPVVSSRRTSGA